MNGNSKEIGYLMIILMLVMFILFNSGIIKPFFGGDEKPEFVPVYNFEYIREAVDSMEYVQGYIDNLTAFLEAKTIRVEELENTDWFVNYELVKGELEKERESYPSVLLFAYFGGFIGFIIAFTITIIVYRKQNLDLKKRIKSLEAEQKKEPEPKNKKQESKKSGDEDGRKKSKT